MQKQKSEKDTLVAVSESLAARIGAWVLLGAALLASTEVLYEQHHPAAFYPIGSGHIAQIAHTAPEVSAARAEGTRETARLPEEFDVGLRMTAISGA